MEVAEPIGSTSTEVLVGGTAVERLGGAGSVQVVQVMRATSSMSTCAVWWVSGWWPRSCDAAAHLQYRVVQRRGAASSGSTLALEKRNVMTPASELRSGPRKDWERG